MQIAPDVSDHRAIPLLHTFRIDREVLIPKGKIRIDCTGPAYHLLLELHWEGVPHIDHDAVDPKILLVIGNDIGYLLPERLIDILFACQPGIVHADGVVSDVVKIRMLVHLEERDIAPGGLPEI